MRAYNNVSMKGRLYNYALQEAEYNGKPVIRGSISIEVDEEGTIVEVQYYATETYNSGKPNRTYNILKDIYEGKMRPVTEFPDDADWVDAQGNIGIDYFIPRGQAASSIDDLVRAQKVRGSFLNQNKLRKYENKWKADLLLSGIQEVEADEERKLDRYALVKGWVFDDYSKRATEVQMDVRSEAGINYMLNLGISPDNPYYVSSWGKIGKIKTTFEQKSAFGEDEIIERETKRWILSSIAENPYEIGDLSGITAEELKTAQEKMIEYKQDCLDKALKRAEESDRQKLAF